MNKKKVSNKYVKLSPAAKVQIITDLMFREEEHLCSECHTKYTIKKGLITRKDARKLLGL